MVLNVMCYFFLRHGVLGQRLNDTALRGETHLRATGHHLSHEITQCYLSPDTAKRAPSNPSQKS